MDELFQFFFPVRCAGCQRYDSTGFCFGCQKKIPPNPRHVQVPELEATLSLGSYAWPLRETVIQMKFHHKKILSKSLGTLLSQRIRTSSWKFDVVTSVPMTPIRRRERGYNQARELAWQISKNFEVPCVDFLTTRRSFRHQLGLGKKERVSNVKDAFQIQQSRFAEKRSILLVDDVVTTGATLSECAVTLKRAGAEKVLGACVAFQEDKS